MGMQKPMPRMPHEDPEFPGYEDAEMYEAAKRAWGRRMDRWVESNGFDS